MLEELLGFVAEGGVKSYEELTRRMSISQPMLEAMLQDLARLGYLRPVSDECGDHCASCSIGSCSINGPGRVWTLTSKGLRAAGYSA